MRRSTRGESQGTTRALDVDLSLRGVPRGRRAAHLAAALRSAVRSGRLAPGGLLPSSRQLAADLGVTRGLVVEVYDQLVAEGHLVAARGSGTRVAAASAGGVRPAERAGAGLGSTVDGGVVVSPAGPPGGEPVRIAGDNPGRPDPALFPRRAWLAAVGAALRELPDADLSYGDARGLARLRSELAAYLGRVRSITAGPDQIVIVNGFAQGLAVFARFLVDRTGASANHAGPLIAVEDPGSVGTAIQLEAFGARIVPVPVDGEGIDTDALDRSGAQAVVVTPAHQYPTGVTLGPARRHALVAWARRRDGLIVEDDYDADYRYDRAPLTSLHALAPDRVVAGGSTSKSLSPALRLGWLVAPRAVADELARIKASFDIGAPTIAQAALAELIADGGLDRHLRRTRAEYRRRRDALTTALAAAAPGLAPEGIAAGLHVLIPLPDGHDEDRLAARARDLGLDAQPLGRYRRSGPGRPGLVLGYATATPDALRRAVSRLFDPTG